MEDMIQRMSSVNDVLVELNNALASWEGRLAAHNSLGSAAKDFEFSDEFQVAICHAVNLLYAVYCIYIYIFRIVIIFGSYL